MIRELEHAGRVYLNLSTAELAAKGVPAEIIGAQLKGDAMLALQTLVDGARAKLASTSAGKLAEYRVKEELSIDPASADPAELDLIDREASARGMTREDLLALIAQRAAAFRQVALQVGALEAELKAALEAVPDTAVDIEGQIAAIMANAQTQALAEIAIAIALLT